jgi:hypothetical protein
MRVIRFPRGGVQATIGDIGRLLVGGIVSASLKAKVGRRGAPALGGVGHLTLDVRRTGGRLTILARRLRARRAVGDRPRLESSKLGHRLTADGWQLIIEQGRRRRGLGTAVRRVLRVTR